MVYEEMTWRSMRSAPKDGTPILAWRWDIQSAVIVRYGSAAELLTEEELETWGRDKSHEPAWFFAGFVSGGRLDSEEVLSRWMPRPGVGASNSFLKDNP
jgi:hypothetical protein